MVDSKTVHIALASDQNYVMPLTVALCSVAANCDKSRKLVFYVIQSGIHSHLRRKVESSLRRTACTNTSIHWLEAPTEQLGNLKIVSRYLTALTYAKVLLPDILPNELDRVLFLDSDVVATADLSQLWDLPLGDKALFAARDRIGWVGAPGGLSNHRELNIPPDTKYFNSGVLYINLQKWREKKISERIISYIRKNWEILRMEDQEALNAVLFDDWGELPFEWNWQIPWRYFRNGMRIMAWVPQAGRTNIIHFTCAEKPWLPGCDVAERIQFFHYLDQTEWAGWRVPIHKEVFGRILHSIQDLRFILGDYRRRVADWGAAESIHRFDT